jgi:propanediol dehydratase large subunit
LYNSDEEREDDVMSIASAMSNVELAQTIVQMHETTERTMQQMQANFQRQTEEMTNNFRAMMTAAPVRSRATPRNRTTATNADGPPAPSPQKIAFDNDHAQVTNATDAISKQIQELNIKELWWVSQWVEEAKLKYDMNGRELRSYKDKVWTYGAKQTAGMTIQARNTTRT